MRSVLTLVLLLAACSRAPASPQPYAPSEVVELASLPDGYVAGGSLNEACTTTPRDAFENEALSDVDCSYSRLSRTLQARAGERGSRYLVAKRCRSSAGSRPRLSCTASLARPTQAVPLNERAVIGAPAPSAAQVRDLDELRPQDARRILVSFRAVSDSVPSPPARAYDRVEETAQPSVGRRELGQVSARCEATCTSESLRHALRVTAGRVGAGEVSAVACFEEEDGARCVATALVPWSS